ncbi:Fatty acid 2-hydroxylase 1 [Abeliophyllum distichum]|uniref:Fatty acid 2-hydroxylase 1 n=1 Tax=Abeliophyllum distichum TaxID=126358 RepID=A0ABD1V342_9LAMI
MVNQAFTVDLNKPLVFQVGHLGEAYEEWVHQPIVGKETPRFFASDIMEFFTRTAWWAIPLIWLPVVCWFVFTSAKIGLSPCELAATVVGGLFIWTLLEYSLHRFLFHIKTKGYWANTLHYLIHGCHHKHPMDGLRLVFPPAATLILLVPFWSLIKFLAPASYAPAIFGGGLLGYVMYDCTHYYLHHGKPLKGVSHDLKKLIFPGVRLDYSLIPPPTSAHACNVGHLGEAYQEWVHQPIASKEGPRFFESDFWERPNPSLIRIDGLLIELRRCWKRRTAAPALLEGTTSSAAAGAVGLNSSARTGATVGGNNSAQRPRGAAGRLSSVCRRCYFSSQRRTALLLG